MWTVSIAIRHVRTTEQLADILTKGVFTTTQWTSLMQLFAFVHHLNGVLTAGFQNQVALHESLTRHPVSATLSATSSMGLGKRNWKILQVRFSGQKAA